MFKRSRRSSASSSALANSSFGRRLRLEALEPRYLLAAFDVLVFSKTAGFRHSSIDEGIAAIQALGAANDFTVTATEDATQFNAANLANYEAVVFLCTTGDVLNASQQTAFEQYIQNGGGWAGIHSAADTEYSWAWYGELVGAYFQSHPAIQQATVVVADRVHVSTAHLPQQWTRTDEWYNYQINPRGDVHVLATLDESTYSGGADGHDHPIAWYHDFDGGRAWYTGLGHTEASYSEQNYRNHILGGIRYAAGQVPSDGGATIDDNFEKVVLDAEALNPMSLEVAPDGRVFYVERQGTVKIYHPTSGNTTVAANLNVFSGNEDGLLGLAFDPDFANNNWVYLFYSPAGPTEKFNLSRFTLVGSQLDMSSEEIILEVFNQRAESGHSAGSLTFDPEGNLYISTGDDTSPFASSGYTPIDERSGRSEWDAQKSSANANDLRGKILRIRPEADGTYSIPNGNLFPADGSAGRPEIYVMGSRNPFRISIDSETGWLYWGDVGPDASNNSASRGPRGYDEINQARDAGNYGWPYVIANNQAYRDYNFDTGVSGPSFNPAAPVNNSPNNSGQQNLPPAEGALIWYPYAVSSEFPELGTGGRTAMAGPVYHFDPALAATNKLPEYYDDTLFIYDWSRNSIHEVKLDSSGDIAKINPFAPEIPLIRPIDMEMEPDGAIYVLEWGSDFGGNNADAQLVRIDYLGDATIQSADFDEDSDVDGRDFLSWQRGFGIPGAAIPSDGDADVDGDVDQDDLTVWRATYGTVSALATSSTLSSAGTDEANHYLVVETSFADSLLPFLPSLREAALAFMNLLGNDTHAEKTIALDDPDVSDASFDKLFREGGLLVRSPASSDPIGVSRTNRHEGDDGDTMDWEAVDLALERWVILQV